MSQYIFEHKMDSRHWNRYLHFEFFEEKLVVNEKLQTKFDTRWHQQGKERRRQSTFSATCPHNFVQVQISHDQITFPVLFDIAYDTLKELALKNTFVQEGRCFSNTQNMSKCKLANRGFCINLICWFYFQFRILFHLWRLAGLACRKYGQVSQLA